MKFGASSFIWVSPFSNDSLHLFEKVKSQGFDVLEVCIEDPYTIDTSAIADESRKTGVEVAICGAFGPGRDIGSEDASVRQSGIDYIKTCVDIAAKFNSKLVSGPMYAQTGKTDLKTSDERNRQTAWAVRNMQTVAEYAKASGVRLAVEPLNRFETDFMNTVGQGLEFLEQIGADNVGFLLDTFHMNIEEKQIGQAIKKAGSKIFNFHACGSDRGTPGEDHINWDEVRDALYSVGYTGCLTIESFNSDITEIARAVSLWRPLADSADKLAVNGLRFLKQKFS